MIRSSEALAELAGALVCAQAALSDVHTDAAANTGKYRYTYATLATTWNAIREPLTSNGLALIQGVQTEGSQVVVTARLVHTSGQWVETSLALPLPRDPTPQAVGSAVSYGRRYTLQALVGVATSDDDGAEASRRPQEARGRAQGPQRTQDRPQGPQEPQGPPKRHPQWERDRPRFMARISDLGWGYDQLCRFLESLGRPRPSAMSNEDRDKLIAWLTSGAAEDRVAAFLEAEEQAAASGEVPGLP